MFDPKFVNVAREQHFTNWRGKFQSWLTRQSLFVSLYLVTKQFYKSTNRQLRKKLWRLQCCLVNSAGATLRGQQCVFVNVTWRDLDQSRAGTLRWDMIYNSVCQTTSCSVCTGWAKKNRTCLSIDNSVMVSGRKTCDMSKVSECCKE